LKPVVNGILVQGSVARHLQSLGNVVDYSDHS